MARKQHYQPPEQSAFGQIVDALLILVLVAASLFAPVYFGLAGGGKAPLAFAEKTWDAMGQNAAMQAQWEKLGYTAETAAPLIAERFDYNFSWVECAITAIVVAAYFVFIVRYSDKEYREVLAERFGED